MLRLRSQNGLGQNDFFNVKKPMMASLFLGTLHPICLQPQMGVGREEEGRNTAWPDQGKIGYRETNGGPFSGRSGIWASAWEKEVNGQLEWHLQWSLFLQISQQGHISRAINRIPGGGNGNPLQYSCLENSMDRGALQAIVHGVGKSRTWLSNWAGTHTPRKDLVGRKEPLAFCCSSDPSIQAALQFGQQPTHPSPPGPLYDSKLSFPGV